MTRHQWSLTLGATVLLSTVVIFASQRFRSGGPLERRQTVELSERIPAKLPDVVVEDLPLGPNEYVDQKARNKLDYDDVVYRSYKTQQGVFTVYVGFWKAGRFSPSFIAAHTPDRCWTLAGMKCIDYQAGYTLSGVEQRIPQGEWRRFATKDGQVIYVTFWQLVGDQLHDYGGRFHSFTAPWVRIRDVIGDLFIPHGDQYFIRITSERPFEELRSSPAFNAVLRSFAALGLDHQPREG